MATNPGVELMLIGSALVNIRFAVRSGMCRRVANVTAPGQPFKDVRRSLDWKSAESEYRRLFPEGAWKRSAWIRITTIAGITCFAAGIYLIFR